jgi:hypothetical protein
MTVWVNNAKLFDFCCGENKVKKVPKVGVQMLTTTWLAPSVPKLRLSPAPRALRSIDLVYTGDKLGIH